MITEHLLSFTIVVIIQLAFFIFHALAVGEGHKILSYLWKGMALGLPFGIIFDLLIGKVVGIYDYEIGFIWWFLIINGIFSFGFMIANVFLLQHHSLLHVLTWSSGLGIVYELTNYYFPVWEWTFATNPILELVIVVFAGYFGLVAIMMACMRLLYKFHFRLLLF